MRSFGTEDRETPYPIAPQPTVYDYILFRGSDIKDIRVVNNVAIPNDPAIMQMHLPPSQMPPQQQGFPPQSFPPMQQQPGQYAPFGQMQGGPPMNANNMSGPNLQQQLQQSISSPQIQVQQQQQMQSNQQGNAINNLTPTTNNSGHSKKSSELSSNNKNEKLSSEKSSSQTTNSQASAPMLNMRKQSSKSQGLQISFSLSHFLPFCQDFFML